MITRPFLSVAACLILAGAALAHSGVKNAAVKARMDAMSAIALEVKTLGQMAKGAAAFDRNRARSAAASIAKHAAETPAMFAGEDKDPKSEATDAIWNNFADFTERSESLEALALKLSGSISTENDLPPALKSLGAACKACHKVYREEK